MGTDVAERIAKHKASKSPALTRKEKQANREAVKELAAKHMEAAIKKLGEIVADENAPASAKVAAATQLLDRVAGKPSPFILLRKAVFTGWIPRISGTDRMIGPSLR